MTPVPQFEQIHFLLQYFQNVNINSAGKDHDWEASEGIKSG